MAHTRGIYALLLACFSGSMQRRRFRDALSTALAIARRLRLGTAPQNSSSTDVYNVFRRHLRNVRLP